MIVGDPLKINIYAHNIRFVANSEDIDFEDLVISTQMEEHIHALQIKAIETDLKNELAEKEIQLDEEKIQEVLADLNTAEELIMEVGAKEFRQNVLFPYVTGRPAPVILDPEFTIPDDYHENRETVRELAIKYVSESASLIEKLQ